MPRGFGGVKQASAEIEARRSNTGTIQSALWFRLKSGGETIVRFLEQDEDIHWAMMHEVPVDGRQWGRDVACVDQERDGTPCPGCEEDLPRKFKGYINVIWDDAPVFKRDDNGKLVKDTTGDPVVIDHTPQVAIWSSGIRLFEDLDDLNSTWRGLVSRRFKVKRTGSGFDTKYRISPEDVDSGPQPLSEREQILADKKYDLNEYVKPPSYEEFQKEINGVGRFGGGNPGGGNAGGFAKVGSGKENPFLSRNKH
jgi:hypothetical protein